MSVIVGGQGNLLKTGYGFNVWNTQSNGLGTAYEGNDSFAIGDHTFLFAHLVTNSYTVTFDPNGGSVDPTTRQVTCDAAYGTLPTPSRPLHSFLGWYTASTGGSLVTAARFVTNPNNHTLHARWQSDVTASTVSSFSPSDESLGVPMSSSLVIILSEPVVFGTRTIRLRKTGFTAIQSFDMANPPAKLSIDGNVVTIVPTSLEEGLNHYVQIDNTAIKDLAGNAYGGINTEGTWTFSVTAAGTLLYDNLNGTTRTTINQNLATRQQGAMATSSFTIEAGSDQKFSSSNLKTFSGQQVVNDVDFKTTLTGSADPGLDGFTLRIKIENDGTGPVDSYLSTHSETDGCSVSRFGPHVLDSANTNRQRRRQPGRRGGWHGCWGLRILPQKRMRCCPQAIRKTAMI